MPSPSPSISPTVAPRLRSTFPSTSDYGPNSPVSPNTAPNRNTQRLQQNQRQQSKQDQQSQLENTLPALRASPPSALSQSVNQAGLNSTSALGRRVASSTTKA